MSTNEKKIISSTGRISHGYGTSKYEVEYQGDWTVKELVDFCDGSTSNFGGRIEYARQTERGTTKATVCVYYD